MCEFANYKTHRLGYFKNGEMIKSVDPNRKNNLIITEPNCFNAQGDIAMSGFIFENYAGKWCMKGFEDSKSGKVVIIDEKAP
jgi:hypothetical protein